MGKREEKPKLNSEQLIGRLEKKGVKFDLYSIEQASVFLSKHNNYFKLTSYRKNYRTSKNAEGIVQYVDLDFMHLIVLSRIDMLLRYHLLQMCLDIEHSLKVRCLKIIEENTIDDGYSIVKDYVDYKKSDLVPFKKDIVREVSRNVGSIYLRDLMAKHEVTCASTVLGDFPVWAFLEVISLGTLRDFIAYYDNKYKLGDKQLVYLIGLVREVRNASAHNSCMLNNLQNDFVGMKHFSDQRIHNFLSQAGVNPSRKKIKLSNPVLHQIVSVFYTHEIIVSSEAIRKNRSKEFRDLVNNAIVPENALFEKNEIIKSSFELFASIADYICVMNSVDKMDCV
jgi:hypothetical protein